MAAKRKVSPFRKGRPSASFTSGGGTPFLAPKPDEPLVFAPLVPLEGMLSAEMHEHWDIRPAIYYPCIGPDCPGEEVGNEPRFKGYLPIALKDGTVAVYPFTISVYKQLEAIEDELPDKSLAGYLLKISKSGAGLRTRYTVMPLGKSVDISSFEEPDFIDQLGPQTREEIVELLEENGFVFEEGAAPSAPAPSADNEDDDDEGWGDV